MIAERDTNASGFRRRRRRLAAYTLLEVMLVLGILAVLAGVSWPVLMRPWSRSLAQEAAQELTKQLLEARRRAVEESRVYRLRWQRGSGAYEIMSPGVAEERAADSMQSLRSAIPETLAVGQQPAGDQLPRSTDSSDSSATGANTAIGVNDPATRAAEPMDVHTSLPHAVTFGRAPKTAELLDAALTDAVQPETDGDDEPKANQEQLQAGTDAPVELPWSDPLWFYPDGRSSNGHWTLVSEEGYEIDVYLRGLTGTVRVGRVRSSMPTTSDDTELSQDGSTEILPTEEREPPTTRTIE